MNTSCQQPAAVTADIADDYSGAVNLDAYLQTEDGAFTDGDYNWPTRHRNLVRGITAREPGREASSNRILPRFVLEQAAERYFMLVHDAEASLKGRFTEAEFNVILNTTCHTIWEWDTYTSVYSMVADDNGVDDLDELEPDSTLHALLLKLSQLSPVENATLVDACERVWRGHPNPLL